MKSEKKETAKTAASEIKNIGQNIAVIRIKGKIDLRKDVKDTLNMLRLYKKHCCVVLKATPNNLGMIKKVKDYVTWGEIDDATLKLLIEKREKGKKFFALSPPKGGFERKGIKVSFIAKGALGYRKDKINDLLKRMI